MSALIVSAFGFDGQIHYQEDNNMHFMGIFTSYMMRDAFRYPIAVVVCGFVVVSELYSCYAEFISLRPSDAYMRR